MAIHTLTHTDGGKCLYDSETKEIHKFIQVDGKVYIGNMWLSFFETFESFAASTEQKSIIPVFCLKIAKQGRRDKVTLINGNFSTEFFNVERIDDKWEKNKIEEMQPKNAYLLFVSRSERADNGCLILSSKKLKGDNNAK